MLKYLLPVNLCVCMLSVSYGQPVGPVKYKDPVFQEVTINKNLSYRENTPDGINKKFCHFDLYQAAYDSLEPARPLIIWMHGGGFKFGSKNADGIQLWCNSFARRGYVCAAINYRLSKKHPLRNYKEMAEGCNDAVMDVEQAVAFFKKNCAKFRIDTSRIILAGNSAGGMIALQAAYSSHAEMAKLSGFGDTASIPAYYNPENIAAVINFWGAIFNLEWLKNTRVPIVSVHGRKDNIVPVDHRNTPFYGSLAIHLKADSLNIPNRLKIYDGYSHELQKRFNPFFESGATKQRWLDAGKFAADFLYDTLYK